MTRDDDPPRADADSSRDTDEIAIAKPMLGAAERSRVDDVLRSGRLAAGDEVAAFESAFAEYCGVDHGVATANGTAALHAVLEALDIGAGDRVITTPFSFVATANAIRLAGAEPVFADIDPDTYLLDPDAVADRLDARDDVAAILVVHLYGLPADMPAFTALADEHDVALVEDAAQAHGASVRDRPVGSIGDAACFSFYPTKNMTTGEGGMVTTDDERIADRVESFVDHGRAARQYDHQRVGHNLRMTDIAAAIGREQLRRLPSLTERRRRNAGRLSSSLAGTRLQPQAVPDDRRHVYHQFTVRCRDRDWLQSRLEASDIGSRVYYPTPIPRQSAYSGYPVDCPNADDAAESVLSLPVHPGLDDAQIDRIGRTVNGALEEAVRA